MVSLAYNNDIDTTVHMAMRAMRKSGKSRQAKKLSASIEGVIMASKACDFEINQKAA